MITSPLCSFRSRSTALVFLTVMFSWGQVGMMTAQAGYSKQRFAAPRFSQSSAAEGISNPELKKYAKALIEIEPLRVNALGTISKRMEGNLPNLMCNQPDSMSSLPGDARKVFVNYCNQSQSIAQGYGLGLERFNEITNLVRSNPRLQSRLQRQVTCFQGGSC